METDRNSLKADETAFRKPGGILRISEAMALGIHPLTTYLLRDSNRLQSVSRGLYRLAGLPEMSEPDLIAVARLVPQSVICLISALAFHNITTEIPHERCT
jgi:predicted transcriptional regulator of viral defense system